MIEVRLYRQRGYSHDGADSAVFCPDRKRLGLYRDIYTYDPREHGVSYTLRTGNDTGRIFGASGRTEPDTQRHSGNSGESSRSAYQLYRIETLRQKFSMESRQKDSSLTSKTGANGLFLP